MLEEETDTDEILYPLFEIINEHMTGVPGGGCPPPGCIGECADISELLQDEDGQPIYIASLYLWDKNFNDPALVAKWFEDAGAEAVAVGWVLHDVQNRFRNGRSEDDGVRAWEVVFTMKRKAERRRRS